MQLSDTDIRHRLQDGELGVEPLDDDQIEPASIDLTLSGDVIRIGDGDTYRRTINVQDGYPDDILMPEKEDEAIKLRQGEFILASTNEHISLPDDLAGQLWGRSSIGRLGVIIHTAGWIDPGFEGQLTLEIVNHNPHNMEIPVGMRICQLALTELSSTADEPYGGTGSKYQGQTGTTVSRIEQDFE